jgi:hypothetical protein
VVIVTTPEDLRTRNQWLLQSDTIEGVSADGLMGKPGVNEKRTMAQTQLWANFIWAGLLPGIPVLDGFPGYTASPQELADWTAEVMDWFGLPRYLFVNCSLTELTPIWNENRTHRDIRAIPGYTVPVDAHSQGPAQQQYDWWPFPYDFPTAVWSFATAMRAAMPDPVPTDKWGTARWIQAVQRSAFAEGSNYAAKFDWAVELVGSQPKPVVPDWRRFGWIERHGPGGVKIYVGNDVSEAHWRRYGWMELHGPGGATFHGGDDASGRGDWRKFGWIERHGPGEIEVHKGDGSSEGPDWRRFGWIELHGPGGATFYRGEG